MTQKVRSVDTPTVVFAINMLKGTRRSRVSIRKGKTDQKSRVKTLEARFINNIKRKSIKQIRKR